MARRDGGSVTVEFALIVPFAMLALLVLLQTGLAARDGILVVQAAREGARQAATADTDAEIVAASRASSGGLMLDRLQVSWRAPDGWRAGRRVTVAATYETPALVPGVAGVWPGVKHRAEATMRLEKDR